MPRREDERHLNLSSRHPAACTCKDCTDRFLNNQAIEAKNQAKRLPKKLAKLAKKKRGQGEAVKSHPVDCACASCGLLGSIDFSQTNSSEKPGIIKKLFGKK